MRRAWFLILLAVPGAVAPVQALDLNHLPAWVRSSLSPLVIDWRQLQRETTAPALPTPLGSGALSTVHTGRYSRPAVSGSTPAASAPQGVAPASGVVPGFASAASAPPGVSPASGAASPLTPVHTGGVLPATVKTGGTPLSGLSAVGPGSPPPSAAPNAELKTVSTPGVTKQLQSTPAAAQTLLLRIKTLLDSGNLDAAALPRWLAEQKLETPALVAALDQMTLEHPMDPIYLPICKALWEKLGTGLEEYLKFPYRARIIMGIYLGVLEREEDARKLLSSVPEEWQKRDPTVPMYHVACELLGFRHRCPRLCAWAWKQGATARGPADQAFVCWHLRLACEASGDPSDVRDDLMRWARDALTRPGSEPKWDYALAALIWGHRRLGTHSEGIAEASERLDEAARRGLARQSLPLSLLELARLELDTGDTSSAAAILGEVARTARRPWCVEAAMTELGRLQQACPGGVDRVELPGSLQTVTPRAITVHRRRGEPWIARIFVAGTPGFRLLGATCTAPASRVLVSAPVVRDGRAVIELQVRGSGAVAPGTGEATVEATTNDPAKPKFSVPISLAMVNELAAAPSRLFYGLVQAGQEATLSVTVFGAGEVAVPPVAVDRPDLVRVLVAAAGNRRYHLTCILRAPLNAGVLKGAVRIGEEPDALMLPYYADVQE